MNSEKIVSIHLSIRLEKSTSELSIRNLQLSYYKPTKKTDSKWIKWRNETSNLQKYHFSSFQLKNPYQLISYQKISSEPTTQHPTGPKPATNATLLPEAELREMTASPHPPARWRRRHRKLPRSIKRPLWHFRNSSNYKFQRLTTRRSDSDLGTFRHAIKTTIWYFNN